MPITAKLKQLLSGLGLKAESSPPTLPYQVIRRPDLDLTRQITWELSKYDKRLKAYHYKTLLYTDKGATDEEVKYRVKQYINDVERKFYFEDPA